MVQIYANFEGLGRKLSSVGIIKTPQDLHAFARSFSLNQPLFSFVDVGSGKERADHKIKGEWTTSMRLSDFLNHLIGNSQAFMHVQASNKYHIGYHEDLHLGNHTLANGSVSIQKCYVSLSPITPASI